MKKKKYKFIGVVMLFFMINFLIYALNHPEGFFKIPLWLTYTLYILYIIVMIFMFKKGRDKEN